MTYFEARLSNDMTDILKKVKDKHHLKDKSAAIEYIINKYRKELV